MTSSTKKIPLQPAFYHNAVHPVICEGWNFTHMRKSLAWPHNFT